MFTVEPARLLRLDRGTLSPGDPGLEWTVDKDRSFSRSRNTPLHRISQYGFLSEQSTFLTKNPMTLMALN